MYVPIVHANTQSAIGIGWTICCASLRLYRLLYEITCMKVKHLLFDVSHSESVSTLLKAEAHLPSTPSILASLCARKLKLCLFGCSGFTV